MLPVYKLSRDSVLVHTRKHRCTKLTRLSPRVVDRRVLFGGGGEGGFSFPQVLSDIIIMPCMQHIIAKNYSS